ncbi:MAG: response regulator [Planctomycetota bacterium]
MSRRPRRLHILVIDDDPEFHEAISHAHKDLLSLSVITFQNDATLALEMLHSDTPEQMYQKPVDLVMLDLNMPGMDGHETLAEIRKHPKTKTLPVIVLSNSDLRDDVRGAYAGGATSYVIKPRTIEQLRQTVLQIDSFWSHSAVLPPESDPNRAE